MIARYPGGLKELYSILIPPRAIAHGFAEGMWALDGESGIGIDES